MFGSRLVSAFIDDRSMAFVPSDSVDSPEHAKRRWFIDNKLSTVHQYPGDNTVEVVIVCQSMQLRRSSSCNPIQRDY